VRTLVIQGLFKKCSGIGDLIKKRLKLEAAIMKDEQLLDRIILDPKVMVGKPIIKGTRLTVDFILNLLAHGTTEDEILNEYKGLEVEDIQACFLFATNFLKNTDFMPLIRETV
jgi:uncharacterized protein (DUF433 family)